MLYLTKKPRDLKQGEKENKRQNTKTQRDRKTERYRKTEINKDRWKDRDKKDV